jgi:hypothetical protein
MQPAWEFRAHRLELAKQVREKEEEQRRTARSSRTADSGRRNIHANPAFGDVGALLNRYDPETKTGFLSTTFLPGALDKDASDTLESMLLDFTYYYRQSDGKRNGTFVFSAAFRSKAPQFLTNNNLVMWDDGKTINIGRPKRVVSKVADGVTETLMYNIPRATLERCANDQDVYLKIGHNIIQLTGIRYMIYNMLQVSQ